MGRTFLRTGYQPTQDPHSSWSSDNSFEAYATAKVKFDGVLRWYDEIVEECVVGRVDEQGVVDQRKYHHRRRQHFPMQYILVA